MMEQPPIRNSQLSESWAPSHRATLFSRTLFLSYISLRRTTTAPQRIMHQHPACVSSLFSCSSLSLIQFQPIPLKYGISPEVCEGVTGVDKTVIEAARHEIRWLNGSGHIYLGIAASTCSMMFVSMSFCMCDTHTHSRDSVSVPRSLSLWSLVEFRLCTLVPGLALTESCPPCLPHLSRVLVSG